MRGWCGKQLRFFLDEKDVFCGIGHSHKIVEYRVVGVGGNGVWRG